MTPEQLRQRLEALNRGPLPKAAPDPSAPSAARTPPESLIGPAVTRLEQLIDGRVVELGAGRCYCVSRRLSRCWPNDDQIGTRFAAALDDARSRTDLVDRDLAPLVEAGAPQLLFMDLETCGFAGTPVFLVGCMWFADGDLHLEQILARNYEEEPAIVARFAELSRQRPLLVTFNGKSFDWPFLRDRAAVSRIELDEPAGHCDLLYASRRCYRTILPDCKLQTLEVFVCQRRRVSDIPGSEIPAAYHDFVQTRDARQLREVVHHNFLDLVTLAELVIDLLAPRHRRR